MDLVYIFHVVICIFLVLTILFQDGKTGGLTGVADTASQTVFGAQGAGNFLTKLTTGLAICFMITSLALAIFNSPSNKGIASDYQPPETAGTSTLENKNGGDAAQGDVQTVDENGNVVTKTLAESVDNIEVITDPSQVPAEVLETHQQDLERRKKEAEAEKKDDQKEQN